MRALHGLWRTVFPTNDNLNQLQNIRVCDLVAFLWIITVVNWYGYRVLCVCVCVVDIVI